MELAQPSAVLRVDAVCKRIEYSATPAFFHRVATPPSAWPSASGSNLFDPHCQRHSGRKGSPRCLAFTTSSRLDEGGQRHVTEQPHSAMCVHQVWRSGVSATLEGEAIPTLRPHFRASSTVGHVNREGVRPPPRAPRRVARACGRGTGSTRCAVLQSACYVEGRSGAAKCALSYRTWIARATRTARVR